MATKPTPTWMDHTRMAFVFLVVMPGFMYLRSGPAANGAQNLFRVGCLGVGVAGTACMTILIGRRATRDRMEKDDQGNV